MALSGKWMPDRLWDIDTPQNICAVEMSLLDGGGRVLDTWWPVRFGFREFWIEGRDFYLNGTRIFLSAATLDNAQVSAGLATYEAARESLERLKSFGINYVYTHNYGCEPGSHLSFGEILRAADDEGMLVGFTQPHFSHYDWPGPEADQTNGYARHAEYYVRAAQNHPSVVMYSMSHNATGYDEDMNPDMIDGIHDARDKWGRAEQRSRPCGRKRSSGIWIRAGSCIIMPRGTWDRCTRSIFTRISFRSQELSDWFGHWAAKGVKPVFTCEYGAPFTWDWTMYRGWYKGQREWGSAAVPWEFCLAEWNAQFFGDRAYQISEAEKENLRWEARQFEAGRVWHRWDYPNEVGSTRFEERYPVFAQYLSDNLRAFRTWGVSANFAVGVRAFLETAGRGGQGTRELKVDWEKLQRPGYSPDYIWQRDDRMDLAYERTDWMATAAAEALMRNNRPLLAWHRGQAGRIHEQGPQFPSGRNGGETAHRHQQLPAKGDVRLPVAAGAAADSGRARKVTVQTGQQERLALRFELPATLASGRYHSSATVKFSDGETQKDRLSIDIMPRQRPRR